MSLTFAVAIYFIIWWVTLFAVMPFHVRTQDETGDVVPGTPESAPSRPPFSRILITNTLVASAVFGLIWTIIVFRWIDLDLMKIGTGASPV